MLAKRPTAGMGRIGTECPECGSPRQRRRENPGRANNGSIPVHGHTCIDCKTRYITAMVTIPQGTSISALDEGYRSRHRIYSRGRQGYWGTKPRGGVRLESDRLEITVKLIPGRKYGYPTPPTCSVTSRIATEIEEVA
jgi:hypothetical protein